MGLFRLVIDFFLKRGPFKLRGEGIYMLLHLRWVRMTHKTIFLSILSVLLSVTTLVSCGDERRLNFLKDPGFENLENGPEGWRASEGMDLIPVASGAKDGMYACLLRPERFGANVRQEFVVDLDNISSWNNIISFGIWVRSDTEPANIKLAILRGGNSQRLSNNISIYNNVSKEWQFLTVSAELAPEFHSEGLGIYIYPDDGYNGGSINDVYIDGAIATTVKLKNIFASRASPKQNITNRFNTTFLSITISAIVVILFSMRLISPLYLQEAQSLPEGIFKDRDTLTAITIPLTGVMIPYLLLNRIDWGPGPSLLWLPVPHAFLRPNIMVFGQVCFQPHPLS